MYLSGSTVLLESTAYRSRAHVTVTSYTSSTSTHHASFVNINGNNVTILRCESPFGMQHTTAHFPSEHPLQLPPVGDDNVLDSRRRIRQLQACSPSVHRTLLHNAKDDRLVGSNRASHFYSCCCSVYFQRGVYQNLANVPVRPPAPTAQPHELGELGDD